MVEPFSAFGNIAGDVAANGEPGLHVPLWKAPQRHSEHDTRLMNPYSRGVRKASRSRHQPGCPFLLTSSRPSRACSALEDSWSARSGRAGYVISGLGDTSGSSSTLTAIP